MKNKGIIGLIVLIAVILLIIVVYGYAKVPEGTSQDFSNNNGSGISVIKGPAIEAAPDSHDFGTVIYGDVAEHTFIVKNLGDEPLEILRLSTSCGCTNATIAEEDKIIAPGQSVDMLVTFDPAVHKDDSDLGYVTRIVYIKTNDPANPEVEVEITAKVIK